MENINTCNRGPCLHLPTSGFNSILDNDFTCMLYPLSTIVGGIFLNRNSYLLVLTLQENTTCMWMRVNFLQSRSYKPKRNEFPDMLWAIKFGS